MDWSLQSPFPFQTGRRWCSSDAPLALLFERSTGYPAAPIAGMASIAMINGILVQIVMASRVLYGMAREGMIPAIFGRLDAKRATPALAILFLTAAILALALFVPFLQLASLTSFIMLLIFVAVNASLYIIGARPGAPENSAVGAGGGCLAPSFPWGSPQWRRLAKCAGA